MKVIYCGMNSKLPLYFHPMLGVIVLRVIAPTYWSKTAVAAPFIKHMGTKPKVEQYQYLAGFKIQNSSSVLIVINYFPLCH
jgi:hypothetical protein